MAADFGGALVRRTGAILWMLCVQFFVAEQLVRSSWTLPYSFAKNYVSDLGAAYSPWHALMNGSFVLQGLLIAGGAVLTRKRWSLLALVVCGVGVIAVGFVPEDVGSRLHRIGAGLHFLGGGLGMIAVGLGIRRGFGRFSVAAGMVVLAATVELGLGGGMWAQQMGVLERVAAYGIAGWMVAAGVWLYSVS